jgi:HEPN domain-containing protein
MNTKASYWIELSDYDLDTADAMLTTGRYLYVGFMCHQSIEKALKAYWSDVLEEPPLKIHSLLRLAEKTNLIDEMSEEQRLLMDKLEPLNIETRYPSYKAQLSKDLNKEVCASLISQTKSLQQWIKAKL